MGILPERRFTVLSKVYHLIERFSEDIDLVLDWRVLGVENPLAERSKTKQIQLNEALNEQAQQYIGRELLGLVEAALDGVCGCRVDADDPFVIDVNYPAAFPDDYLRPEVRLEIGPLASWLPYEDRQISCYAAEAFPKVFEQHECAVKVIKAERTFWEKATILHHEAHRPEGNLQPPRYSRHYYDLAKMAESPVKAQALTDPELLASVVEFKQRFYPRGWARYDLAKPGTLVLVPEGHVLGAVRSDYKAMENMIFGKVPEFEEILAVLQALQEEINA
ncbi:MAG: nucleotidyl transferase AbiEii/AbiGii toxin family protein [Candidatus Sedimenticola endophacoides]|uniref:Nucleotidyl transferase AbiEii/AbiGii toxin family protein n=1 Tax=Candidatus Sedimenticola endophacoides TaxID=2548426 RepID=A0A6N4DEC2_9GAMM|nr:MAG: nucleotidyl transferase AbiEii/AbiGii toxin family protein [Candidatus Sedimenticola endophacoides]PUE03588.1 MAG: nucleotidyl transferase AbiEii/AbiGii toxin family protein [Candidatus Sedimenticola endophacoides]PUE05571.1 MAG: nucleotidyl transferase AbiEii/AbiGii toxin family protein [Candidatus Sedimenticola endophacoides]